MKRRLFILTGLLAVAALAYGLAHWLLMRQAPHPSGPHGEPLAWMQEEFRLDDATFAKVQALHNSYQPTCGGLCLAIAKANGRVRTLMQQSHSLTPELEAAIRDAHLRQAECRTAMLRHIYETAALLPPEAAQRYLTTVTGRLTDEGLCISEALEKQP